MKKLLTIITTIILFSSLQLSAQTKRALVIGIGEQEDRCWAKINGDKDVPYVKEMLTRLGYQDINTLVNRQATKAGIVSAFKKLAAKCMNGDVIYIHFSGHGQQVTDVNGDETDKWDEAWIPYDAYMKYDANKYKGEKHLIDDEINMLLTGIKDKIGNNGKLMVVVDACHSGDSSRGIDGETVRGAGILDRFVIPGTYNKKTKRLTEKWLTLSACKNYQLNQEMKTPRVGKLTYALYTISENGSVTKEAIQRFMQRNRGRYSQTPIQTGDTLTLKISDFLR